MPNNPSLSTTLSEAYTESSLELSDKTSDKLVELDFLFENKTNSKFENRIHNYLSKISDDLPFIKNFRLTINSKNSFPHSAGIASSASAMSALALCIYSVHDQIGNIKQSEHDFLKHATYYARLGSGSAARSVFPAFALWG